MKLRLLGLGFPGHPLCYGKEMQLAIVTFKLMQLAMQGAYAHNHVAVLMINVKVN